ncbi:MAG: DUF3623 domain-containing protein [Sphingomonadales bacterium]|nr:DUF3623 domain-containing protein [Sphingomonadales bacterium]
MHEFALAAAAAVALWWLSTGVIIFLDGLPQSTFRWSMLGASALALAAIWGLWETRATTTPAGAYLAFCCGLVAWGWQTMTFYMGYITGPRKTPCPPGLSGWSRFLAASSTNISHEVAIAAGALLIATIVRDGANQIGLWTYLVLWWMHLSGKLNVYLGVPNLSEEFIPEHLGYLRSYMRCQPMNLLFPVSVTVSTVLTAWLVLLASQHAPGSFEAIAYTLLATLMALAVLEHWLLVLPLPAMALWTWSLSSRNPPQPVIVNASPPIAGPRSA